MIVKVILAIFTRASAQQRSKLETITQHSSCSWPCILDFNPGNIISLRDSYHALHGEFPTPALEGPSRPSFPIAYHGTVSPARTATELPLSATRLRACSRLGVLLPSQILERNVSAWGLFRNSCRVDGYGTTLSVTQPASPLIPRKHQSHLRRQYICYR